MENDFGISCRAKHMAAGHEPFAKLGGVVALSVVRDPAREVPVRHRLSAAFAQIENRETRFDENTVIEDFDPVAVGAAVHEPSSHRACGHNVLCCQFSRRNSSNSAHSVKNLPSKRSCQVNRAYYSPDRAAFRKIGLPEPKNRATILTVPHTELNTRGNTN